MAIRQLAASFRRFTPELNQLPTPTMNSPEELLALPFKQEALPIDKLKFYVKP